MNYLRIAIAAVSAFVAYMLAGGLMFVALPSLKTEFLKFPAVYRDHDGQMSHFPVGMAGILLAIVAATVLYAMTGTSGLASGVAFGALIGLFVVGGFVMHNYANLNIGATITVISAIAYFVEWMIVGVVIGLIYRPVR